MISDGRSVTCPLWGKVGRKPGKGAYNSCCLNPISVKDYINFVKRMSKKNKTVKWLRHWIEYGSARLLGAVLKILPLKVMYLIIELLGLITFYVFRIRRNVTMANLRNALGDEYGEKELIKIARKAYVNIGKTFIEVLVISRFAGNLIDIVDLTDSYILKRNLEKCCGIIIVSCHFGSWELNGASLASYGIPLTVVGKRQSNPYVDRLINRTREKLGIKMISHGASIKYIVKALRKKEAVGLISDQDAGRDGVFVDFFGREASTPRGAAQLAIKYNVPIVVVMTLRTGNGTYKSIIKEIESSDDDSVESLTQRYTKVMEDIIRQYPEQYFWMHRRWKTVST